MSETLIYPALGGVYSATPVESRRARRRPRDRYRRARSTPGRRHRRDSGGLERTHFEDDYADVISLLEDRFDARPDESDVVYEGNAAEDVGDVLNALLTIDSWQRVHALRSIRLFHDGRCCLEYVPEHTSFTLDEDANPAVISAVRTVLEAHPAGVFSTEPFVEWKDGETSYPIAPPSLCVGNTCSGVQMLAGIEPDRDRRVIALSWYEPSAGVLGSMVGGILGLGADIVVGAGVSAVWAYETDRRNVRET
ncbi:hypothetical protein ACFQO4_07310 [Saliphagus sp. GCM10025334]